MKSWLVNWLPWSVLKISGRPCRAKASSSASTQNAASMADRHPPGQNPPAEPVDDGGQVDEAARHRDVGDVHGPDLVGAVDRQPAQQVRVDLVPRRWLLGVRLAVERLDAHALHQVATCRRPMSIPSRLSRSRSIRLPAKG